MKSSGVSLRRVVLIVALANVAYFGVEFTVALRIGSVSLFADSVDFLEDTAINILIFAALPWTAARRSKVGSVLSLVILVPAVATIWTGIHKVLDPTPPDAAVLSLTALGALAVNLSCAFLLARHRHHAGSLTKAAWLSARNDSVANVAMIAVGVTTYWFSTGWIDIAVGIAIPAMNADAAREVWEAARAEAQPEA